MENTAPVRVPCHVTPCSARASARAARGDEPAASTRALTWVSVDDVAGGTGALHLAEEVRVGRAHRERLLALAQAHAQPAAVVARDAGDVPHVDDRAAMDLPEGGRIERSGEVAD